MTHYAVRDDLSFCRVDGRFVFLDVNNDRYFRLPDSMERALARYLEGNGTSNLDISGLIERNILVDQPGTATGGRRSIKPAVRSAMEAPLPPQKLRPSALLEVLAIVLRTRVALKLSTLKNVLDGLGADRQIQPAQDMQHAASLERQLSDAAAVYRHARLYVPVDMCCLLDSVALARFLRRRQLHAHVVFGVALDPFSAHCWVQANDLVLNDTVGNVNSHTPIRVV
jgi:hypothetical protein